MSREKCQQIFGLATRPDQLIVVDGHYGIPASITPGGRLDELCDWLDLPRLVVLDVEELDQCCLPKLPAKTDGILFDRIRSRSQFRQLQTDLETVCGIPVLGALEPLPEVRSQLERHTTDGACLRQWWEQLGRSFAEYWNREQLWRLATQRSWEPCREATLCAKRNLRVAVAFDQAFNRYFPDVFTALEALGATLEHFSPLNDETLPAGTELVIIGCGDVLRHLPALANNHCMKAALRHHVAAGFRIYAEGAGAAFLCQRIETPDGSKYPMAGLLPAVARWHQSSEPPQPVELRTRLASWLFPENSCLRGYRNPCWCFQPAASATGFVHQVEHRFDLIGCYRAVGSLVHLYFAAHSDLLAHFFDPCQAPPYLVDPWQPL